MPFIKPASLRTKLFLLMAGLVCAAAGILFAAARLGHEESLARQQQASVVHTLDMAAAMIRSRYEDLADKRMEAIVDLRTALAHELDIFLSVLDSELAQERAGTMSRETAQQIALSAARKASSRTGLNVFVFDASLKGLANADRSLESLSWKGLRGAAGHDALESAMATARRDGVDTLVLWWPGGESDVSAKHMARLAFFRDWGWYVGVSMDFGRLDARAAQDFNHMVRDVTSSLGRIDIGSAGKLFLSAGSGSSLLLSPRGFTPAELRSALGEVEADSGASPREIMLNGEPHRVFTRFFPELGWRLGLIVKAGDLKGASPSQIRFHLAALALVAVAGVALAWLMARRLARPIHQLAKCAAGINPRQGASPKIIHEMRTLASQSHGETALMAQAWADALEALGSLISGLTEASRESERVSRELSESKLELERVNEGLENHVRQRTAALEAANRRLKVSEARYRGLFTDSPVPYMELDLSALGAFLDSPGMSPVTDLLNLLEDNTEFAANCFRLVGVLETNPAGLDLIGARSKAEITENIHLIIQPLGIYNFHQAMLAFRDGARTHCFESPILTLRGRMITVYASLRPLPGREHALDQVMLTMQDITSLRQGEERLRQAHEAAEAASKAKSEFLANMSHEIRTPLSAILGLTELSLRNPGVEKNKAHLTMIAESARDLLAIIGDVLDLSRVESGKLTLDKRHFDLRSTLDRILAPFRDQCRSRGLDLNEDFQAGMPDTLIGDPVRLGQIVTNLLSNAVKFTPPGGSITFTVTVEARSDSQVWLLVSVQDSGEGVPPGLRDAIFESFRQADSSYSKKYQGAGLGLAICRELASLMGGSIWLDTPLEGGSIFRFTARFDLDSDASRPDTPPVHPATAGHPASRTGHRILVAEDNPYNRHVFKEFLSSLGHTVLTALDGAEALATLSAEPVDFVFMDVQMPDMDGLEAVSRLRAGQCGEGPSRVPVVALTAYAMTGDKERFMKAGMTSYLAKPVSLDALEGMLAQYLPGAAPRQGADDTAKHGPETVEPGGDAGALAPLMAEFVEYVRQRTAEAGTFIETGNLAEAAKAGHDVKGTSLTFGAGKVNEAGARLEKAARDGNAGAAMLAVEEIYGALSGLEVDASPASADMQ